MKIESINLKNVYSFGKAGTPELTDFNQLNLFIGKNGSGKSNVLRAICDLDVYEIYDEDSQKFSYRLNYNSFHRYKPFIPINPTDANSDIYIKFDSQEVVFKDGDHVKGNFKNIARYITYDSSILVFKDKLNQMTITKQWPAVISFALYYIYQLDFSFEKGGVLTEWFTIKKDGRRGTHGNRIMFPEKWSSGFMAVSNILFGFLETRNDITCIDEPEIHLEPRTLRRLFELLIWILNRGNIIIDNETKSLVTDIEDKWLNWFKNSTWSKSPKLNTINSFASIGTKQLFISSHSSVLINEFYKYSNLCNIYEFNRIFQDTSYFDMRDNQKEAIKQVSALSSVRRVGNYPHSILDNLGAKASDILQTNGIIWVEGPSDIVYIKKWLQMYTIENKFTELKQGIDYEFQMYGGTLLDSICLMNEGHPEVDELKKLVSMFSFSRNAYIITDSDAIQKNNGVISDQSKFKKAKDFIANEFEKLSNLNYSLGLWYKKNNTDIRTLEDYLDDKTITDFKLQKDSCLTKKIYAQTVTKGWDDKKLLADFKYSLSDEIKSLYDTIVKWNEL